MDAWTPGEEELAIILGFAREAELNTALIERIVPSARSGERKRKVAHVIARCEFALDALADESNKPKAEAPPAPPPTDPSKDPGKYNRERIFASVEEAAKAAGE